MRNVLIASDPAAQLAGEQLLAAGGNAADAVVGALLAGATASSPAALLGSATILVAGAGVGAHRVDGRALAPGLHAPRPKIPSVVPDSWRAAVPRLMPAALTTLARFGSMAVGPVARAAIAAVKELHEERPVRARTLLLEDLARAGAEVLVRAGIREAVLQLLGPIAAGNFTRADFDRSESVNVDELVSLPVDEHEVLVPLADEAPRHQAPAPPSTPLGAAIAGDHRGVLAIALWAQPQEALELPTEHAVCLAALDQAPSRGVTRRKPGSAIPMPLPAALLRHQGRAWAALALAGEGSGLERGAARALAQRLGSVGLDATSALQGLMGPSSEAAPFLGELLWLTRSVGDTVHSEREALRTAQL